MGLRKEAGDTAIKDIKNIFRLKISGTWKIQLTIAISFISSRDNDEEPVINSKSDSIEIMINDGEDEVIKQVFKSLKKQIKTIANWFVFN